MPTMIPLPQPRKDPFISHPLPSKFSTSESLFLPIGMNCQVLPLIETSSSRLQLRSHIAGSLQFPIPTLACPSTSVSIPRPPLLVPSALTKASRTPSHPYSNIHPGPIRNEPTPRPEYYSGQKRKRLLHPAPEKEMKKPKSSKEGTNKEPPFHENSLIFSPCFQCFTTIRFYAKLCNELLEVCEELDKPANTDTRIIIWNYLFWITGDPSTPPSQACFQPVINQWLESEMLDVAKIEYLYLAFSCVPTHKTISQRGQLKKK